MNEWQGKKTDSEEEALMLCAEPEDSSVSSTLGVNAGPIIRHLFAEEEREGFHVIVNLNNRAPSKSID
jgi:hypothetical protein